MAKQNIWHVTLENKIVSALVSKNHLMECTKSKLALYCVLSSKMPIERKHCQE